MRNLHFLIVPALLLVMVSSARAQYSVKVEPDTILAGEEQAKITVSTDKTNLNLNCVARKGGGNFSDFKLVATGSGQVNQATFETPFPGEVQIEVLDGKFNKIGVGDVTVVAPIVEIMEQESLDRFDGRSKSMPLMVRVVDHRGQFVKTAKLTCKISEIVNKKTVASSAKVTDFVLRDTYYEAAITGLKDASYKVEVTDVNHVEAFDKADNPDNAHPSAVIEGLNITIE
ncbi:hypothetical protein HUU42_03465 [bacterium]|nr:hypothetical protein [bacterium]